MGCICATYEYNPWNRQRAKELDTSREMDWLMKWNHYTPTTSLCRGIIIHPMLSANSQFQLANHHRESGIDTYSMWHHQHNVSHIWHHWWHHNIIFRFRWDPLSIFHGWTKISCCSRQKISCDPLVQAIDGNGWLRKDHIESIQFILSYHVHTSLMPKAIWARKFPDQISWI